MFVNLAVCALSCLLVVVLCCCCLMFGVCLFCVFDACDQLFVASARLLLCIVAVFDWCLLLAFHAGVRCSLIVADSCCFVG